MTDNKIHVDPFAIRAQNEIMQTSRRYTNIARSVALDALLSSGKQRDDYEATAKIYNAKSEAMEEAARIIGGIVMDDNGLPR